MIGGHHSLCYGRELSWRPSHNEIVSKLAFSSGRIRSFSRSPAVIDHDGCINTAAWSANGELLYTGSDDRLIKIWRVKSAYDGVQLQHTIETKHRGNIFTVEPKPDDPNTIVSGAADGTVKISYVDSHHNGTTLLSSEDFIHMISFDQDQPNILYTAEECGQIHRIDLRCGRKDVIFQHTAACYSAFASYRPAVGVLFPSWTSPGSVKSLLQTRSIASPHLLVGGKGYFIGMLDLRLTRSAEGGTTYVKLWSPCLPYTNDQEHDPDLLERYSHLAPQHPYGRQASSAVNPKALSLTTSHLSTSGLSASKCGHRIVASYQGDQIFTFNLRGRQDAIGAQAVIGGHINFSTFLKSVAFFGPQDEYVVAGSDSGHMWVWGSSPTAYKDKLGSTRYDCPLINVLKADIRTCNGVVPHPHAPLLLSYGIDSDAKLWLHQTPAEDIGESQSPPLNQEAGGEAVASKLTTSSALDLCKHDGARDRSAYDRISLALTGYHTGDRNCDVYCLPSVLGRNKGLAHPPPAGADNHVTSLLTMTQYPRAIGPFQFNDISYNLLEHFLAQHVHPCNAEEKALLDADFGAFMPADAVFDMLDNGQMDFQGLQDYVSGPFGDLPSLAVAKPQLLEAYGRFQKLFVARNAARLAEGGIGFQVFVSDERINWTTDMLSNYLLLPFIQMYRIAENAKLNGNNAFKAKNWQLAHHFYCKSFRYAKHLLAVASLYSIDNRNKDQQRRERELRKSMRIREARRRHQEEDMDNVDEEGLSLQEELEAIEDEFNAEQSREHDGQIPGGNDQVTELGATLGPQFDIDLLKDDFLPADGSSSHRISLDPIELHNMCRRIVTAVCPKLAPELAKVSLSNLSAAFLSMEKYSDALHVCDDAIALIKEQKLDVDAKLLFRRGSANLQLNNHENAVDDLTAALAQCPQDAAIAAKLKQAKRLHELKRKREMQAYTRMFASDDG